MSLQTGFFTATFYPKRSNAFQLEVPLQNGPYQKSFPELVLVGEQFYSLDQTYPVYKEVDPPLAIQKTADANELRNIHRTWG